MGLTVKDRRRVRELMSDPLLKAAENICGAWILLKFMREQNHNPHSPLPQSDKEPK